MPMKRPRIHMLWLYMGLTAMAAYLGMWFEKPNLLAFAMLGMLWYLAQILFTGVRLLAEIRDQTKRTGQR